MTEFEAMCEELTREIQASYESGINMDEAEKLAGKFLHAQIQVSTELQKADLDVRMRKSGVKAVKAAIYLDEVSKQEKKPSDTLLEHKVNVNELVISEQKAFDEAEVRLNKLENYFNIFKEAHVHFRGISKARFT